MLRLRVENSYWESGQYLVRRTARLYKGAVSELGAFWIKDGNLYKSSVPWNSDKVYQAGDFRSFDSNPEQSWADVVKANPGLSESDYTEIDRGQVQFENGKFKVIVSKNLFRNSEIENLIIQNFYLPPAGGDKGTVFIPDQEFVGKPTFQTRRKIHDKNR
jgi:hypothetical protein